MEVILILKLKIFIGAFEKAYCSKHTMSMMVSFSMLHILKRVVSIIVDISKLSCSPHIKI